MLSKKKQWNRGDENYTGTICRNTTCLLLFLLCRFTECCIHSKISDWRHYMQFPARERNSWYTITSLAANQGKNTLQFWEELHHLMLWFGNDTKCFHGLSLIMAHWVSLLQSLDWHQDQTFRWYPPLLKCFYWNYIFRFLWVLYPYYILYASYKL